MKAVVEIELIRLIIHNNDGKIAEATKKDCRGNQERGQSYRTNITGGLGEGGKGVDESDGKVNL